MKHYKYISRNKAEREKEFWVCDKCRKLNSNLILEGKWRLIDRRDGGELTCCICSENEKL